MTSPYTDQPHGIELENGMRTIAFQTLVLKCLESVTLEANLQRRQLLVILHQEELPKQLSAVAYSLAVERGESGPENVERIYLRLHHNHLPKLAEAGIVSYDVEQNIVDLTEQGRTLAENLE